MPRWRRRKNWARFLWTRTLIISGIKALRREGVPLNSASIQKNKTPHASSILKNVLGIETTGSKLFHGAVGFYGTWDEALRRAGLDPYRVRKHEEYWSKDLILTAITALHSHGIRLHANGIQKDKSAETMRLLKHAVGRDVSGLNLHSAGIRIFGSWSNSLKASGLNPEAIRRDQSFWTKEIIIQSIQALHQKGVPIHIYRLSRDRSEETTKILATIVHRPVTGSALYVAAIKKFKAWNKVLRTAGIEPCEVRNDTKIWTKRQIIEAVRALHNARVPLCVVEIEKDRSSRTRRIIYRASKLRTTGRKLYRSSASKFGSWDKVLKAAGIDPGQIRRTTSCLSKEEIIRRIRSLNRKDIPLNRASLDKLSNQVVSKKIKIRNLNSKFAIKLCSDAQKQFGSWDKALLAADLDPKKIRRDRGFWTKELIVDSVFALKAARTPMNCTFMQFNTDPEISEIISSITDRYTTGASLYGAVVARYGSWTKAIRAIKKNPDWLGGNARYISGWLVQKSIRKLHGNGVSLNSKSVQNNRSIQAKQIVKSVTEGPATTLSIYRAARKHFRTWDEALARSSLDPSKIRRSGMSIRQSGLAIKDVISTIHDSGFALNATAIFDKSASIRAATYFKLRKVISGKSTWSAARRQHGDWEAALRTAGFDPIEIVRRSSKKWSLSTVAHQFERIETEEGVRRIAYLGQPPKAPDQIHEENLRAQRMDEAIQAMTCEDQDLISPIFDHILSVPNFSNQEELIGLLAESLGGKATPDQIRAIFRNLSLNPELKELL